MPQNCMNPFWQSEEGPPAPGEVPVPGRGVRGALLHVSPAGEHRQRNRVKEKNREDRKRRIILSNNLENSFVWCHIKIVGELIVMAGMK